MSENLFIGMCVMGLPFLRFQQQEEGRNYVLMIMCGIYLIYSLMSGDLRITFDNVTLICCLFIVWMAVSCLWTYSKRSNLDFYMMTSCIVVFLVSRTVDILSLMLMIFIPGIIFAINGLVLKIRNIHPKNPIDYNNSWIFGNGVHTGSFDLVQVFIGLWLSLNFHWMCIFPTMLCAVDMWLSGSRAANISMIMGVVFAISTGTKYGIVSIIATLVFAFIYYRYTTPKDKNKLHKNRDGWRSSNRRLIFYYAALKLWLKKPLFGWGMRTFRREYPAIGTELTKDPIALKIYSATPSENKERSCVENFMSHRVHNDFLEIAYELGIVGLVMFSLLLFNIYNPANPVLAGLLVAFCINSLFFFPFREVHTAIPFWVAMGAMSHITLTSVYSVNIFVSLIFSLIILKTIFDMLLRVKGLVFYDRFLAIKEEIHKKRLIIEAIKCDPYNGKYLSNGYYYHVETEPHIAYQYASRCFEHYDGGVVKWGAADQLARAILKLGGFNIARLLAQYALAICPGFKISSILLYQIDQTEKGFLEKTKNLEMAEATANGK